MDISFVICTDGRADCRIDEIVDSIEWQEIPDYEVLIVGGDHTTVKRNRVRHLPHDESGRKDWITGKKNRANREARNDVVVFLHDYHLFAADWYREMRAFGFDWDSAQQTALLVALSAVAAFVVRDRVTAPVPAPSVNA